MSKQIDAAQRDGSPGRNGRPAPPLCVPPSADLGLAELVRGMVDAGWRLDAPDARAPDAVSVCFVAHAPGEAETHLVYAYARGVSVAVEDLWRIVTDARASGCGHAVMILPSDATLDGPVRGTAARLNVRILRLAGA